MATLFNWEMPSKHLLLKTFSTQVVQEILNARVGRSERSFWYVVKSRAFHLVEGVHTYPTCRDNFIQVLQHVLSDHAKRQLSENMSYFDHLTQYNASDSFLGHYTFEKWLLILSEALMESSASKRTIVVSDSSAAGSPSSQWNRSLSTTLSSAPCFSKDIPQLDGPFDTISRDNRIVQVNLEGPSIVAAWARNRTIVDPRYRAYLAKIDELSLRRGQDPAQGGWYSFHGTAGHLVHGQDWAQFWYNDSVGISGQDRDTQMNPRGVKAVYTGFSALRCFLWAAFLDHVYFNIPDASRLRFMQQRWSSQGNQFQGVAVLVFEPPPCVYLTLPKDRSTIFANKVTEMGHGPPGGLDWEPDQAWKALSTAHGSRSTKWPEVIHCHEYGEQESSLRPFNVNIWRSVWVGQGIQKLNTSYRFTMAITYTFKEDSLEVERQIPGPSQQRPQDEDDQEEEGKGKKKLFGTLRRGLRKSVSGLLLKK